MLSLLSCCLVLVKKGTEDQTRENSIKSKVSIWFRKRKKQQKGEGGGKCSKEAEKHGPVARRKPNTTTY